MSRHHVPVLLMNPEEEIDNMAKRRTTRRRTTRRKTTARRAAPRRRTTRRKTTTRRRRRKRNPLGKANVKDTLIAGLGGAAVGLGAYALKGQPVSATAQAGILAAVGLLAGGLATGWNKSVGAGIAGAGVGLAGKLALEQYMARQASGLGRIPNYGYKKFGHTPANPAYHNLPMGAVRANLGAVQTDLGAYEAMMNSVEAQMA